jgi:CRISPR-associated exonuclease Cas4
MVSLSGVEAEGVGGRVEPVLVTDLKQWAYCPRIVFYRQTMPGAGKPTYKMEEGRSAQEMIEELEMRRTLREYGLEGARRRFGVWLEDDGVGLAGKLDLLLEGEREAAVVDFKLTAGDVAENHRLQLAGYAVLVEGALGLPVGRAFLYRIPDNRVFHVEVTGALRERVRRAVEAIRWMRNQQLCPEPTPVRGRCLECEYANYCGDVW